MHPIEEKEIEELIYHARRILSYAPSDDEEWDKLPNERKEFYEEIANLINAYENMQ